MIHMYSLPDSLRAKLQEPLGKLVDTKGLLAILKKTKTLVTVGDQVTYTALINGYTPRMCIVDFIIKRSAYAEDMKRRILEFKGVHIRVKNSPAMISDELWDAIATGYAQIQTSPCCIEVDGEEDLAALAAIYLAPSDVTVIYGLPDKGVVVIKATQANKQMIKEILDKM
jgi:uncharacterized protein (UPF0218 family)